MSVPVDKGVSKEEVRKRPAQESDKHWPLGKLLFFLEERPVLGSEHTYMYETPALFLRTISSLINFLSARISTPRSFQLAQLPPRITDPLGGGSSRRGTDSLRTGETHPSPRADSGLIDSYFDRPHKG